jgi:predicted RND superfamily exporter protein
MSNFFARIILRYRISILVVLGVITVFMAYEGRKVELSYDFAELLPEDDTTFTDYELFKSFFHQDGNQLILGTNYDQLKDIEHFKAWTALGKEIKNIIVPRTYWANDQWNTDYIHGTDSVFSVANLYTLKKNTETKSFDFVKVNAQAPQSQAELDSIFAVVQDLPFYDGLIYNEKSNSSLMIVFVDRDVLNSNARQFFVDELNEMLVEKEKILGPVHRTGLPYIRTIMTMKTKAELRFFIIASLLVTATLLYLFFRSFKVMLYSMLVVGVGVIWSLGVIAMLGFKLTALMGLIPPLIIVIGVPNSVYLINKFHQEYREHGNKIKALNRIIRKVGGATLLTNVTTALGFATFIFTQSNILVEFGIAASINILLVFVLTIFIIPIVFSLLGNPKPRHIKHLDRQWLIKYVKYLIHLVTDHRSKIYWVSGLVFVISLIGITQVETTGNIVDDLPKGDQVKEDLIYFEEHYGGVMPFEVLIDTKKNGNATKASTLKKIETLQEYFDSIPQFSRSLSITDAVKFAKQAYYNGRPEKYSLISGREKSFIAPYLKSKESGANKISENNQDVSGGFLDPDKRYVRVSLQVADLGTKPMEQLLSDIQPRVDQIFDPADYRVVFTGSNITYLKGTNYLVKNLFISLMIAIGLIAILMAFLFRSTRMVLISLIPNILPLVFTGGIMGWFGVPLKPSTILVFSIAFGISIDDTIHYLAKFRQELHVLHHRITPSVLNALRETGVSMFYTSIILFFGFSVFVLSDFGSTIAMGVLVSLTLIVAMFANLLLLPALLLTLDKRIMIKAMDEPSLKVFDEDKEEGDEEQED